jgi:biotin carboxylase
MQRKILILTAGQYQITTISKAKEMGLFVIATDKNPDAPGFKYADIGRAIDVKDFFNTLKVAKEFSIDAVMTESNDFAVLTVAKIAKELNLVGISPEAAIAATNKGIMRKKWEENGVPSPIFAIVENLKEAISFANKTGYPVVIKPTDNMASRGVKMINSEKELKDNFSETLKYSSEGKVIIEEFMDGKELTVEGFTYEGETEILSISDKSKKPGIYSPCVSSSLDYPSSIDKETKEKVINIVKKGIKALGIERGPTHTEVILTKDGPKLVEMGARGGGNYVFSKIIQLVTGIDIVKEYIKMLLGEVPQIKPEQQNGVVLRFFSAPFGRIVNIKGIDLAKEIEGVVDIGFNFKIGEVISSIETDVGRPGWVIVKGKDQEEAKKRADLVENIINFEVEKI